MPRKRMYVDMDVVTAARERIRHVYETFDEVYVQYSGGKDSTALLWLAKEFHEENDLGPVKVIFRDEEILSPMIERHMLRVREYSWVDMRWFCLPQALEVWFLGRREYMLTWSKRREEVGRLFRPFPEWAYRAEHFGIDPAKPIPQPIDYYTMVGTSGMVAFLIGVRANESMVRYRSLVQKLHENYIVKPWKLNPSIPLRFAKPIYDWETNDVLKYIQESGGSYCEFYDAAAISGANTRVGVPLHAMAARRLNDVVATEPEFYDRLWRVWPQIDAQRRWWQDYDIESYISYYAEGGWDGVRECIEDNMLTPGIAKAAAAFAHKYRQKHNKDPFSYPIDHLIRTLLLNAFSGVAPSPVGPKTRAHAMRIAALQEERDLDDMDRLDDAFEH